MSTYPCLPMTSTSYRPPRSTSCIKCSPNYESPLLELHLMGNARRTYALAATIALPLALACTAAPPPASSPAAVAAPARAPTYPTGNDPRNGLKYGMLDAGTAQSGMRLVSFTPKPAEFDSVRGLT